jgi:hypothetical protein
MTTFKRICLRDHPMEDPRTGEQFSLRRGQEYITGAERADGNVTVFSTYWVAVPASLFAGELQFTGQAEDAGQAQA